MGHGTPRQVRSIEQSKSFHPSSRVARARSSWGNLSSPRSISYRRWLEVLASYMPEFHKDLWAEYGPKLLGPHTDPPNAGAPTDETRVLYLPWLARFQVDPLAVY